MLGHAVKPVALVAGALVTPGTLSTVVLFTVVAAAELLLNDTIFACPCDPDLALLYGLSFMLIPGVILFLADFPWKMFSHWPGAGTIFSFSRRPMGLAVTWVIIGALQRKYVDCITRTLGETCEDSVLSSSLQLASLFLWLFIVLFAVVMVLCRRSRASCISGRSTALEMQIRYQMNLQKEKENLQKRVKYGTTKFVIEDELSFQSLESLQPGLNVNTYETLRTEELLHPRVMLHLKQEDVYALDISIAQRCLLRSLISKLAKTPELLTTDRGKNGSDLGFNKPVCFESFELAMEAGDGDMKQG